MREWWNGIHSRLKICRRKAYEFESRLSHQTCRISSVDRASVFYTVGREFESLMRRQLG